MEKVPKGFKRCTLCGKIKHIDEYYLKGNGGGNRRSRCKHCERARSRKYQKKKNPLPRRETVDAKVMSQPYTYQNDIQRESVEDFLKSIGWRWNGKLWWKPNVKSINGKWNDRYDCEIKVKLTKAQIAYRKRTKDSKGLFVKD